MSSQTIHSTVHFSALCVDELPLLLHLDAECVMPSFCIVLFAFSIGDSELDFQMSQPGSDPTEAGPRHVRPLRLGRGAFHDKLGGLTWAVVQFIMHVRFFF
jgi:hypothetical protein